MSLQIECSIEKSVTIRAAKRLEKCINVFHLAYVVVVSQNLHMFSYFGTLCLASSPIMFPSTLLISYSRMFRVSRSSAIGVSFIWTRWNWSVLNPSILLMNKLNNFEVSSSSRWFPCKWRARARQRHKLSLYGFLACSSNVRQLIVPFFTRGSGKIAFLHPIGTSLSNAAHAGKFVNLSCRTFTLCSFFLGYKTLWRQFCWEKLLVLQCCPCCTQVWIDPAGYCFHVRKNIWTLHHLYFSKRIQKLDSLLLHTLYCWKKDQVFCRQFLQWGSL